EGLAVALGIARSTVYLWADKHPEFSDILELLLSQQAAQLIQNGLSGRYNSTITKLMLTKHGYSDKQEVEHKGERIVVVPPAVSAAFNLHGPDEEAGRSNTK